MKQLFVYGTLKEGECRASQLTGRRISVDAFTQPDYRMYRLDGYPGLIEVTPGTGVSILGELWEIESANLSQIDLLEGVDEGWFERRPIRLANPLVKDAAEAYFYLKSVVGRVECGRQW